MEERGSVVGEMYSSFGGLGWSIGAPARRAALPVAMPLPQPQKRKRSVSVEKRQRVIAQDDGTFRVVTVITSTQEEVVDAAGLAFLGLEPPTDRRDAPAIPIEDRPETHALRHWTNVVRGGLDARIRSAMPTWVREFGLDRVQEAMNLVAAQRMKSSPSDKYFHLVKTLRRFRAAAAGE